MDLLASICLLPDFHSIRATRHIGLKGKFIPYWRKKIPCIRKYYLADENIILNRYSTHYLYMIKRPKDTFNETECSFICFICSDSFLLTVWEFLFLHTTNNYRSFRPFTNMY